MQRPTTPQAPRLQRLESAYPIAFPQLKTAKRLTEALEIPAALLYTDDEQQANPR